MLLMVRSTRCSLKPRLTAQRVTRSLNSSSSSSPPDNKLAVQKRLFLRGLSPRATVADLREALSEYELTEVSLVSPGVGRKRNAFLEVDPQSARDLLRRCTVTVAEAEVTVEVARGRATWRELHVGLNQSLVEAGTATELGGLYSASATDFSPMNLATMMHRLGKLRARPPAALLRQTAESIESDGDWSSREIANVAWALARTEADGRDVIAAICRRAERGDLAFRPQEISITAWSLASLKGSDELLPLVTLLARQALASLHGFKSQEVANLAWAFGKLVERRLRSGEGLVAALIPALFERIAARVLSLDEMEPRHMATLSWAFSKAKVHAPRVFQAIARQAALKLDDFTPLELATTIGAFADVATVLRVTGRHDKAFECISPPLFAGAAERSDFGDFRPRDLAYLLWSFSKVNVVAPIFMRRLVAESIAKMEFFEASDLFDLDRGLTNERTEWAYSREAGLVAELRLAIAWQRERLARGVFPGEQQGEPAMAAMAAQRERLALEEQQERIRPDPIAAQRKRLAGGPLEEQERIRPAVAAQRERLAGGGHLEQQERIRPAVLTEKRERLARGGGRLEEQRAQPAVLNERFARGGPRLHERAQPAVLHERARLKEQPAVLPGERATRPMVKQARPPSLLLSRARPLLPADDEEKTWPKHFTPPLALLPADEEKTWPKHFTPPLKERPPVLLPHKNEISPTAARSRRRRRRKEAPEKTAPSPGKRRSSRHQPC